MRARIRRLSVLVLCPVVSSAAFPLFSLLLPGRCTRSGLNAVVWVPGALQKRVQLIRIEWS